MLIASAGINEAHSLLDSFCSPNAGIGISRALVEKLLLDQVNLANKVINQVIANEGFHTLDTRFSGTINTSALGLIFSNVTNPEKPTEFFPTIEIEGLQIALSIFIEQREVAVIVIDFQRIVAQIIFEKRRMRLVKIGDQHGVKSTDKKWEHDEILKSFFETSFKFGPDDWLDLGVYLRAISVFSGSEICESVVQALEFPDLLSIFVGVKFGDDVRIRCDADMVMLTATSELDFSHCPTSPFSGSIRTTATSTSTATEAWSGHEGKTKQPKRTKEDVFVNVGVDDDSPSNQYPPGPPVPEKLHQGDVFLFTPITLIQQNFNGVVKPSITASDTGSFGPIYWRYSLTAALKQQGFSLKVFPTWPIRFTIDAPVDVTAQCGAGIKIGCVRYEAAGAMADGSVDPLQIEFRINLDVPRLELVFESRIADIQGKDFSFRTFPEAEFPVSQILDFLLARIAEAAITGQAGRILNTTRIPLARFGVLKRVADLVNGLAGVSDGAGNVTMGAKLKLV